MFKITRRSSIFVFVIALALSVVAVILAPQFYYDKVVEVPVLAFFAGEIGLSLLVALLFYESASTSQAVKLAASILGLSMFVGAIGNVVGQTSQMLPENFVLVNWVQLVIMNLCGIVCCVSFYKLEPEADYAYIAGPRWQSLPQPQVTKEIASETGQEDFSPPDEMKGEFSTSTKPKESAADILGRLDVKRIAELERTLHPESMTMEGLFQEHDRPGAGQGLGAMAPDMVSPAQGAAEPDAGADLDHLFADIGAPVFATAKGAVSAPLNPLEGAAVPDASCDLSEFGRLSLKGKVSTEGQPLGTMRTIGKMLLDVQAVENVIRVGPQAPSRSLTKHVVTPEEGAEIDAFLEKISSFPQVSGALLIGYDGLVIANTLGQSLDQLTLAVLAFAIHTQTNIGSQRLGLRRLQTTLLKSQDKFLVISAIAGGVLVVFSEPYLPGGMEGLLGAIAAAQSTRSKT